MTLDEFNKVIRDTINMTVNLDTPALAHYINAPKPKTGSFATVNVNNIRKIGTKDISYESAGNDLAEKVVMVYESSVSVSFFRAGANQNSGIFIGSMQSNLVTEFLSSLGVGFIRVSDLRDLTILDKASYDERSQVDLFVQFELTPVIRTVIGIDVARVKGDIENHTGIIESVDSLIPSTP